MKYLYEEYLYKDFLGKIVKPLLFFKKVIKIYTLNRLFCKQFIEIDVHRNIIYV